MKKLLEKLMARFTAAHPAAVVFVSLLTVSVVICLILAGCAGLGLFKKPDGVAEELCEELIRETGIAVLNEDIDADLSPDTPDPNKGIRDRGERLERIIENAQTGGKDC